MIKRNKSFRIFNYGNGFLVRLYKTYNNTEISKSYNLLIYKSISQKNSRIMQPIIITISHV